VHLCLCQRSPELQEDARFEHNISRVFGEFSLNGELISSGPERPALGRKQHPEKAFGNPSKSLKDGEKIRKRGGIPVNLEQFPTTAPDKLGKRTSEKNVISILKPMTKSTIAMAMFDLSIGGQSVSGQLPDKNTNFERASHLADIFSMGNRGSLNHSLVKGSSRKDPSWFKIP
jgi:hypothetical protein